MVTRRKTWVSAGLFTLAGTTAPIAAAPVLDNAHPPSVIDGAIIAPVMHLAQGGEGAFGGEGGDAELPLSYALPTSGPTQYDSGDEIGAYIAGVHASYQAASAAAVELQAAVDALLADRGEETLAAAREAWVAARPAYLVTEAFRFYDGPIEAIEGEINAWPINEAFIDYVAGAPDSGIVNHPDPELTVASLIVRNQVSDESDVTLGWHAVEFLLWGQDMSAAGPGDRPVSDYTPGVGNNDRRRAYLKLTTDRLTADLGRLVQSWAPDQPDNYAATFAALEPREAIGRIMNGLAVLAGFELMSERIAVGLDSGDQEDEHSCFSDTTHQDFVFDLKGIENVWTGEYPGYTGPGIRDLVVRVDAGLAAEVDALVADATAKIAALGDPWDRVLASPEGSPERAAAEAAVTALGELAQGFKRAGDSLGVLVQISSG